MSRFRIALIVVGVLTFAVGMFLVAEAPITNDPPTVRGLSLFGWGMIAIGSMCIIQAVKPPKSPPPSSP